MKSELETIGDMYVSNGEQMVPLSSAPAAVSSALKSNIGQMTNPMAAVGDMIVGSTAGALARMAVNATATPEVPVSASGATALRQLTVQDIEYPYIVLGGAKNAYTGTMGLSGYPATPFLFSALQGAASSDGATTIALDGLVAKDVKDRFGNAITQQMVQNSYCDFLWDGTKFYMLNSTSVVAPYTALGGAKNAYTGVLGLKAWPTAPFSFDGKITAATSDSASTIALDGLVAKDLLDKAGGAISTNIVQNTYYHFIWNGTAVIALVASA